MHKNSARFRRKFRDFPHRWEERVNPSMWLFLAGLVLLLIGGSFSPLRMLAWVGGFIVGVYVLIWVVWAAFMAQGG